MCKLPSPLGTFGDRIFFVKGFVYREYCKDVLLKILFYVVFCFYSIIHKIDDYEHCADKYSCKESSYGSIF